MPGAVKVPCQAVAIRFVADPRTDEFLNIGVVLLCPAHRYAGARFVASWSRISQAFPGTDLVHLRRIKRLFETACETWTADAQHPNLFKSIENVGALVATIIGNDDASLQLSRVISGVTANPENTLAELFRVYVAKEEEERDEGRNDADVWDGLVKIASPVLVHSLQTRKLRSARYEQTFDKSWKNGVWNAAQPLSFDMQDPQRIREKALLWSSRIRELDPGSNEMTVHFLVGLPDKERPEEVRKAARDALDILDEQAKSRLDAKVVREKDMERLVQKIERDLKHQAAVPAAEE